MKHQSCNELTTHFVHQTVDQTDIASDPFPWNDMLSIPLHVRLMLPLAAISMIYLHESTNHSIKFCLIGIFIGFLFFTLTSAPKTGHANAIDCLFDWMFDRSHSKQNHQHSHTSNSVVINQSINQSTSRTSKRKTVSLKFSIKKLSFHVHHWCYLLMFYLVIYFHLHIYMQSSTFDLIGGFCLGGFVQGLKYDDWHRVVWINRSLSQSVQQSTAEAAKVVDWSDSSDDDSLVDSIDLLSSH